MRIIIVVEEHYPIGGGIQQYLRGLGAQLRRMGHTVTLLTRAIEGCPEREEWPEGTVIRTPVLVGALQEPAVVLARWPQLVPLIAAAAPDVVYANNHASVATIKACQHLGVPVVYGCHGWGLLCPLRVRFLRPDNSLCFNERSVERCVACQRMRQAPSRVTGMRSALRRLIWGARLRRDIARRVAQYDAFQEILESANARIVLAHAHRAFFRSANTFAIPLGIDTEVFRPSPAEEFRQRYGIEGPYVLVTSRIHNTKGQVWAVRALAHLPPEVVLVLAGNTSLFEGPKHEDSVHARQVRQAAVECGVQRRVVFTGFLDVEELVQAYSGAVTTLVPSVWLEPFGYVTIEAMACACPVVVTNSCGTAELITDGLEGYVVPRMDAVALANAVRKILPRRDELGHAARRRVERELAWPIIARRVLQVFEGALHGAPATNRAAERPA
jgi:glycosyltransferase involved in cell wall biosynthesis